MCAFAAYTSRNRTSVSSVERSVNLQGRSLRTHAVAVRDEKAAEEGVTTVDGEFAGDGVAPNDRLAARNCVWACNDFAVDEGTSDVAAVLDIAEFVMVGVEKWFQKFDRDIWSSAVLEL